MSQETPSSPWYEVFNRNAKADAEPMPSNSQPAEEAWTTEAVYSLYND